VEQGGSWRPFWLVTAVLAAFLVLDLVFPGPDVPALIWLVAIVAVLGIIAGGTMSARRLWTVRVDRDDRHQPDQRRDVRAREHEVEHEEDGEHRRDQPERPPRAALLHVRRAHLGVGSRVSHCAASTAQ